MEIEKVVQILTYPVNTWGDNYSGLVVLTSFGRLFRRSSHEHQWTEVRGVEHPLSTITINKTI